MVRKQLIKIIAARRKVPSGRVEDLVACVFRSMVDAMKRGERVEVRGFGSFAIREHGAYQGRNPRTGEVLDVHPKRLPFFRVSRELREIVNASGRHDSLTAAQR